MKLPNRDKAELGDKLERYSLKMSEGMKMLLNEYDVVALTEEIQATHKDTRQVILLRKGQVGTILMNFEDRTYLVYFADAQGHTYAMETVPSAKLMQLVYEPIVACA